MRLRMACVLCSVALLAGCGSDDEGGDKGATFEALDPNGTHFGKSYGEWGADWWKWVYEMPQTSVAECVMPPDDPTGAKCASGQDPQSPVFFLAGNFGGVTVRTDCKVPADKALFFPILNYSSDNAGVPPEQQLDEDGLKAAVEAFLDSVDVASLFVKVDGKAVPDVGAYKSAITRYTYTLAPEPNTYSCLNYPGVTGKVDPSFAGGYWMMISGLGKGAHTVQFGGTTTATDPFSLDVTYEFTIE